MKPILTLLMLLLSVCSLALAGELTLTQKVANVDLSLVSLRVTASAGGDFEFEGKRQSKSDLEEFIRERSSGIEYVYVSGDELNVQHLLELARLGNALGFQTLYHQNGVLKLITVE